MFAYTATRSVQPLQLVTSEGVCQVELLQNNISNLGETLAELDALPPMPPREDSPEPRSVAAGGGGSIGGAEAPGSPAARAAAPASPSPKDRQSPAAGVAAGGGAHAAGDAERPATAAGAVPAHGGGPRGRAAAPDDDTASQLCNGHAVPDKANVESIAQLRQRAINICQDGSVKQRTH